jgi:hypothetical protein
MVMSPQVSWLFFKALAAIDVDARKSSIKISEHFNGDEY